MRPARFAVAAALLAALLGSIHPLAASSPPFKPLAFSILEDYDKGDSLSDVGRDFALFHELGITTWRGSFGWDDYEPADGHFDFAWLHQFITAADRAGITLRPYVAYTPQWAAGGRADRDAAAWNQPPRSAQAWRRFLLALARELSHHPNVRSLEIFNEENVPQWWEGTVTEYARTLAAARSLRPRFTILAGGLTFPDVHWIENVCRDPLAAGAFDVLPIHAYPETWTPPGVTVENYLGDGFDRGFGAAVDAACGPKKIWVNETGYATTDGRTEEQQAAWWARAIATFAGDRRVEQIGVYEIKDLRPDRPAIGGAPNYHLGLTRVDRSHKLAFATVRTLVALLGQNGVAVRDPGEYVTMTSGAGEFHAQAFERRDGVITLVVWNRTTADRASIREPRADSVFEYRLDGTRHPLVAAATTLDLRAGIPRILEFTSRP